MHMRYPGHTVRPGPPCVTTDIKRHICISLLYRDHGGRDPVTVITVINATFATPPPPYISISQAMLPFLCILNSFSVYNMVTKGT